MPPGVCVCVCVCVCLMGLGLRLGLLGAPPRAPQKLEGSLRDPREKLQLSPHQSQKTPGATARAFEITQPVTCKGVKGKILKSRGLARQRRAVSCAEVFFGAAGRSLSNLQSWATQAHTPQTSLSAAPPGSTGVRASSNRVQQRGSRVPQSRVQQRGSKGSTVQGPTKRVQRFHSPGSNKEGQGLQEGPQSRVQQRGSKGSTVPPTPTTMADAPAAASSGGGGTVSNFGDTLQTTRSSTTHRPKPPNQSNTLEQHFIHQIQKVVLGRDRELDRQLHRLHLWATARSSTSAWRQLSNSPKKPPETVCLQTCSHKGQNPQLPTKTPDLRRGVEPDAGARAGRACSPGRARAGRAGRACSPGRAGGGIGGGI